MQERIELRVRTRQATEATEPARLRAAIRGLVRRFGVSERAAVGRWGAGGGAGAARVRLTAAGRRAALGVADREQDFARQVLERIPEDRRAAVVESLGDLLAAVRGATEAGCPGAFDHLMEGFAAANACGPGDCNCGPATGDVRTTGA